MKKWLSFVTTVAVLSAVAVAYWWVALRENPGAQAQMTGAVPPGVVVEASEAIRATSVRKLKAIGTLASNQSVVVRPEIAGRLAVIHFADGAEVAAGTLLAELDKSVWAAELAEAQAMLDLAEREFVRASELLERGAGTASRRDEAEAALLSARAIVNLAQARLDKCEIYAPFDGRVGIRAVDIGDFLAAGDDIVNIEQIAPIKVDFEVPERFLTDLEVGKVVELRSDAYPGQIFEAEIGAIDPLINARTRAVRVQALAENDEGLLRPGQFVSVTVRVDERRGATFVPEQALIPNVEQPFVYRIVEGKVEIVPVEAGTRIARHVEIRGDSVSPGDLIVTAGQQRLADGVPVIPKDPTFVPPSPPDEEIQILTQ